MMPVMKAQKVHGEQLSLGTGRGQEATGEGVACVYHSLLEMLGCWMTTKDSSSYGRSLLEPIGVLRELWVAGSSRWHTSGTLVLEDHE